MIRSTTYWTALAAACLFGVTATAQTPPDPAPEVPPVEQPSDPDSPKKPGLRPIDKPKSGDRAGAGDLLRPGDGVQVLDDYPEAAKEVGKKLVDAYGEPTGMGPDRILWRDSGPWKRTVLHREPTRHDFPRPHQDFLEQVVNYRVPANMVGDIAQFDGSILVDRTRGEIAARCDSEAMNFLTLNVAHDIVSGQRTVEQARAFKARVAAAFVQGERDNPYVSGLRFDTSGDTADPDERSPSM